MAVAGKIETVKIAVKAVNITYLRILLPIILLQRQHSEMMLK
jgi:hypothetical protein